MSEPINICRECGADLLFSARARGYGLCGPCTRAECTHPSKTRGDEFHPDRCDICHAPVFPPALVPQPPPANPPRGEGTTLLIHRDMLAELHRRAAAYGRLLADLEKWSIKLGQPYPGNDAAATSATETSRSIAAAIRSRLEYERDATASPGSSGEVGEQ